MRKYLYFLIVVLILVVGIWFWQGIYLPKESGTQTEIPFSIEKGQGLTDIASNLEKQGLIKSRFIFEFYALLLNSARNLQAGRYNLTAAMNTPQILSKLTQGDTIKEKIIIIEGWNLRDIGWYFEGEGMFQAEELFEIASFPAVDYSEATDLPQPKDFSDEFDFLKEKPKNIALEGYLFPDTYEIEKDAKIEEIIRKMLQNFNKKITQDLREEIATQEKTLFEILTVASLLEKEIKSYEDRQITAGILWKRLRTGWPLQVDATLTYLTGKASGELTKQDLEIDSHYNTYRYYGLPLGPICNPGLASIKAAIYYEDSPYWFYLTTPEGETIFSKTLEEHNIARFNYLK
ncbi:endolytic transglycosylase MltG [Patescibacteria group bacterium]|nr:endolytic transglycosylase MltG [Patescibacteria group bacterium]